MKIGVIGAMDSEVGLLISQISDPVKKTIARMDFYEGKIGSQSVVVVKCGVGKVNAGICVQILADRFQVTHLINTGVAGSLCNELDIGDILVSEKAMYHDVDATVWGYQLGEVPGMKCAYFNADPELIALAVKAVRESTDVNVKTGMVVSGDQFISTRSKKEWLMEHTEGLVAEMEGAAIAHAAVLNDIPFVIIRAVSDKADDSVNIPFDRFETSAAENCAGIVNYLLRSIA